MAIPKNKTELRSAIETEYAKLKLNLEGVNDSIVLVQLLEGHAKGTKMSVHNLISYLIGWGELVLKWNKKKEKKQRVDFPETGFKWNELGKLAQKFYKDYEHLNFKQLLKKSDKIHSEILKLIESKTNEELYKVKWYEKYTLGRMIQLNTSSPYKNARGRIRKKRNELITKARL